MNELTVRSADIIGIGDHEPETALVKRVVSGGHPVRLARLAVIVLVLVVVAENVVTWNLGTAIQL